MVDYDVLIPKLLKSDCSNFTALEDCFGLIRNLLNEDRVDVETGYKKTDTVIYNEENKRKALEYNSELRKLVMDGIRSGFGDCYYEKLYWQTYLLDAPFKFDSFMLYIEHNRPVQQQYWLPRRKKLSNIADALQKMEDGELDELFLAMPPRTGKTTLMVFFMLWVILRNSERSNLYCSYTDSVVGVFYNGLLEILTDPYTYAWQDVFPLAKIASTNAKDLLLNIDRKKRYASFTGRSLYGTLNGACDCNGYEIADDLVSGIEESMSRDRLDNCWLKVDNNYLPRGKEGSKRLWIGTRWATADPQARRMNLLESDDRFKSIRWEAVCVPALDENDHSNFDYDYGCGFSDEYYLQRRASFERNNDMPSWFAQYQGVPVDRAGSVFEPEDLRYYNGVLPDEDPDRIFMAVDTAWGGGDFVSAPVCFQYGDEIYVHDVVFSNADKTVTQPLIVGMVQKYGIQAITCEGTKATSSYAEGVSQKLAEKSISINVQSSVKNWTYTGKEQRIFDKAPDIREHMLFLSSGKRTRQYEQFMSNVYAFKIGSKNKFDDAPDSLAQAITMAFFTNFKAVVLKRPF